MTILIIKITTSDDPFTGEPESRAAQFIINNGADPWYWYAKGNLPLEGAILPMLEAEEAELYTAAVANGRLATKTEIELGLQIEAYKNDPGMAGAIFGGDPASVQAGINTLVDTAFPTAGAVVKTALKRLFTAAQFGTRYVAFKDELVNGE